MDEKGGKIEIQLNGQFPQEILRGELITKYGIIGLLSECYPPHPINQMIESHSKIHNCISSFYLNIFIYSFLFFIYRT